MAVCVCFILFQIVELHSTGLFFKKEKKKGRKEGEKEEREGVHILGVVVSFPEEEEENVEEEEDKDNGKKSQ